MPEKVWEELRAQVDGLAITQYGQPAEFGHRTESREGGAMLDRIAA
jgi:hypothetical protein